MRSGKKRGPKGERFDDNKALSAMVPLVRKGMSELSAATHVVRQGLVAIKQNETASIDRVRRKFRIARDKLMARRSAGPVYPTINSLGITGAAATPGDLLGSFANQIEPLHVRVLREMSKHSIASQVEMALLRSPTDPIVVAAARASQEYFLAGASEMERTLAMALRSPAEEALRAAGLSPQIHEIMSKTGLR